MNETIKYIASFLASILTAYFALKKSQSKSDVDISKAYLDNNQSLFDEYKIEISRLHNRVEALEKKIDTITENYEEEIRVLKNENGQLKLENSYLKNKIENFINGRGDVDA